MYGNKTTLQGVTPTNIMQQQLQKVNRKKGDFFMKNMKIRNALKDAGMKHWELAELMGISHYTLSVRLRKELPEEEQDRIIKLIHDNRK